MSIDAFGIHIGFLYIRFYGLILMSGALAAAYMAASEARQRGQDTEIVWDGLIWCLIGGIIGARIWHILTPPPSMVAQGITTQWYLTHPLDALSIWNGGLGIMGAVLGGAAALYLFTRKRQLSFLMWCDIAAPGVALAQAIGRWGNFINQELYGAPTNLPWAIRIDPQYRLAGFENEAYYHPLFLYESLWNLANMGLLLGLGRRFKDQIREGDIFFIYLMVYPIGRFLLEFLRLDASMVIGININQWVMLAIALAAGVVLYLRHRNWEGPASENEASIVDETSEIITDETAAEVNEVVEAVLPSTEDDTATEENQ
ncbi:MAG: prolipoprotein diacylglyceryl transferase [Anaerolineales bacterium]|nr:prolipoprotein diacylglyceryl transferase [Anaerolineales bacterium]